MSFSDEPASPEKVVYWGRELPPLAESIEGEHTVEADSPHLPMHTHADELWTYATEPLKAEATRRIIQEVRRQGGSCAHVVDEQIEPHTDYAAGTMWLHGRYTYVMYRHG
jgi:hypothetical protein